MDGNLEAEIVESFQELVSETTIANLRLCTAKDGSDCHILEELPVINEVLRSIGTNLIETDTGKLSLVATSCCVENLDADAKARQASALVYWLLKRHRCIVDVELRVRKVIQPHQALIAHWLRNFAAIKMLRLSKFNVWRSDQQVASSVSGLAGIEVFIGYVDFPPDVIPLLCPLLETTSSLNSLTLVLTNWISPVGRDVWAALTKNDVLNYLRVTIDFPLPEDKDEYPEFLEYLAISTNLKTIMVTDKWGGKNQWLTFVLEALRRNQSILEITFKNFVLDCKEVSLIEQLLKKNSISSFRLQRCVWNGEHGGAVCYDTDDFSALSSRVRPWLSVLQTNGSLQDLRLNFAGFTPAECAAFLEDLAKNASIKNVFIEDLAQYLCCQSRRISCRKPARNVENVLHSRPDLIVSHCRQIRKMCATIENRDEVAWFTNAAIPLGLCHLVNDLQLTERQDYITAEAASTIADYIETTSTLTRFWLQSDFRWNRLEDFRMSEIRTPIFKAFGRNRSIKDLRFDLICVTVQEAELLALSLKTCKQLCYLHLDAGPHSQDVFLTHFSPGLLRNYNLVRAEVGRVDFESACYSRYPKIVARNKELVAQATHFVVGNVTRRSIEAFELVASNPALLDAVCEACSVDELDGARRIQERRYALQDLHGFMKATNVVKMRVTCNACRNCRIQLDDVDWYSWQRVRKYLRVVDVQK